MDLELEVMVSMDPESVVMVSVDLEWEDSESVVMV